MSEARAAGGTLLYGPRAPHLDGGLEPAAWPVPGVEPVRLDEPALQAATVEAWLRDAALQRPFPVSPAPVFSTVHVDEAGEPRVVFLIQPAPGFVEASVALPRPLSLRDVLTDERFSGERALCVPMVGHSCRMLEVCEPDGSSIPAREEAT
jgi:hypothetical protein